VWLATLLAFLLHGCMILTAQYSRSFDAFIHMFFADHYRLDWWTLWEPRWYTGFSVASYPPLVHQWMALLGKLVGIEAAFAVTLWAALTAYPLGIYAFSRAFTGRTVAQYAAWGAAFAPALYLAAHVFGQIPTIVATLFALFGIATLAEFLRRGGWLNFALTVSLFAVVMAAHHATLMFLPWVAAGLVVHLLLNEKPDKRVLFSRVAVFAPAAVAVGLVVIWPFWAWGQGQTIQTPIDHASRHNFLKDTFAFSVFFLPVYGSLMLLIPFAVWKGLQRRYIGLVLAFLPLFVLGLGGTTPLPAILFREGWEWLIYDRFALWASLLLLPFLGVALLLIQRWLPKYFGYRIVRFPRLHIQRRSANSWPPVRMGLPRKMVMSFIFLSMALIAGFVGAFSMFVPFQPAAVDMEPVVRFLGQKNRSEWRYLTFGFGDQLARLSMLTKATTMDGSYHTARSLPELRESGIAQIDTAYWILHGMRALDPILQKSGEHGVRWGFVNLRAYNPVLERNGWVQLARLENGIQVWENPAAVKPEPASPPPEDPLASFSWGVFPFLSLVLTGALAAVRWRPLAARKVLLAIQQLALGLLPVSLCFWYYRTLTATPVEKVYFTYTDALLFAGDALALVALFSGLIAHFSTFSVSPPPNSTLLGIGGRLGGGAFCLLVSLSLLWSVDWRISLSFSLHLWLVFGLFLSIKERPELWRTVAIGFCAALALQILVGFWQFGAQSTAFLQPLGLAWPGALDPSMRGVSVVALPDGARWLRAYGTFPHPNLLGGFTLAFLAGPAALFLLHPRRPRWSVALFAAGVSLLVLTFSRSAWAGLAAAGLVLFFHRHKFERKSLLVLALAGVFGVFAVVAPLNELIFIRAGASQVATETFSNDARAWLIQSALGIIRDYPVFGIGAGTYIVEYARRAPYGYLIEPVHNLPLLVMAELGIVGALLFIVLGVILIWKILRAKRPERVLFSAMLAGLLATSMFDHYLWTLAPGRMLLGLALGLWAAQMAQDQETKPRNQLI